MSNGTCDVGGPPFCSLCRLPLDVEERYRRAVWDYKAGVSTNWQCEECNLTAWTGRHSRFYEPQGEEAE